MVTGTSNVATGTDDVVTGTDDVVTGTDGSKEMTGWSTISRDLLLAISLVDDLLLLQGAVPSITVNFDVFR